MFFVDCMLIFLGFSLLCFLFGSEEAFGISFTVFLVLLAVCVAQWFGGYVFQSLALLASGLLSVAPDLPATFSTVGTLPCALFLVAVLVFATYEVEQERGGWASCILFLTAYLFAQQNEWRVLAFVSNHPGQGLLSLVVYMAVGAFIYAPLKWYLYVKDALRAYQEKKKRFFEGATSDKELMAHREDAWKHHISAYWPQGPAPKAEDHKGDLMRWAIFWPLSGSWMLLHDPITRFYQFAYDFWCDKLNSVSSKVFEKVEGADKEK